MGSEPWERRKTSSSLTHFLVTVEALHMDPKCILFSGPNSGAEKWPIS